MPQLITPFNAVLFKLTEADPNLHVADYEGSG
jgi:hypothetical protein